MSDETLRSLASKAGIETTWRDWSGAEKVVPVDTLRALLPLMDLPCATEAEARASLSIVERGPMAATGFFAGRVGETLVLPATIHTSGSVEIKLESGGRRLLTPIDSDERHLTLPPIDEPGYHTIRAGDEDYTVAVAPTRCVTLADLTPDMPAWGLAAQIYSLRRFGDGGIGDFGAAADLARAAARHGPDMLCLSPVHALFTAEPRHVSPYSPSNRLVYNPVYADPRAVFPDALVGDAIRSAGLTEGWTRLERMESVDWPAANRLRIEMLRALYGELLSPTHAGESYRQDFERFKAHASSVIWDHCGFEVLHAHHLVQDPARWSWRDWPNELHDSSSEAVREFLGKNRHEVEFHLFLQWLANRSHAECQRLCRESGMRVGLISDLAIGMEGSGSHAWSRPHEVLTGAAIGSPPDYYNPEGQNWGLTGFSPRELVASNFRPFIETLRTSLRYAGGVRIDHIAGMNRLWLVPEGAPSLAGAYLNYPSETLFRLLALESWRHKAIVLGEDLGTLPWGFKDYLREQGIAGMRVLRFEHDDVAYHDPAGWDEAAFAMTTTHDAPPTAGWWAGKDLKAPREDGPASNETASVRADDRKKLWSSFQRAGVAEGDQPAPEMTEPVVDAAVAFIAESGCEGRLLSLEDAVGTLVQPNIPGTIEGNWSHRFEQPAARLLEDPAVTRRLKLLGRSGRSTR